MPATKNKSSVASDTWLTPKKIYEELDDEFHFDDFDPCPPDNDIEQFDGLKASWTDRTFCNPPYSQKLKEAFVRKAVEESAKGKLVVMLLPAVTDSAIFHDVIVKNATIRFLRGRIGFEGIDSEGVWVNPKMGWRSERLIIPYGVTKTVFRKGQTGSMLAIFDVCNLYSVTH